MSVTEMETSGFIIISAIYFFLPAYFANMAPVFFRKSFKNLAKPIDHKIMFRGRRLLGDNKTWRGLVVGIMMGVAIVVFQHILYTSTVFFPHLSVFNYSSLLAAMNLGFMMALGALTGDMIKSFFKRGMRFSPGKSWFPFDQIDFAVFGLLFSSMVFFPGWTICITILIASPLLHLLVRLAGYYLKVDNAKF